MLLWSGAMAAFQHRTAVRLIMLLFVLQPIAIGAWLALIPEVQTSLGLSNFQLAMALLGMPAALVPTLQFAGAVVGRFGPRRVFMVGFPAQGLAVMLPLSATSQLGLFVALAVLGAVIAFLVVCLNVYAGRLEKQTGRLIMSRCHGFGALGLMIGSFLVSVIAPPLSAYIALGLLAGLSALTGLAGAHALPRLPGEKTGKAPARRRMSQLPAALFYIAFFMLFVSATEGAMADWSAVYLAERLGPGVAGAGIAVTIHSGFLAGGRFVGDALKSRLGGKGLARLTVSFAILGIIVLAAPLPIWAAYIGFALVGFGVSAAFPLGVSAVASLDDEYETANIATMSIVAISGFLIGPPVIGFLADTISLRAGLAALVPGLFVSILLARHLGVGRQILTKHDASDPSV